MGIKGYANIVKLKQYQDVIYNETLQSLNITGQGAISLFTGGGKSFIGLKIALEYLDNNPEQAVLWLGTSSANKNVYSSVISRLPSKLKDRILMKAYSEIWSGHTEMPVVPKRTCLVVFDESHRALTRYANATIVGIRDSYSCPKVAMSATQRRTDGRRSFDVLVPKAIWHDYDYNWAAEQEVINKLNYFVSNTKIATHDLAELRAYRQLGDVYQDIKDRCNQIDTMLSNYKFDFRKDVYKAIKSSGMSLDAHNGVRHAVFFGSISELEEYHDDIYKVFRQLYPGSDIRVFDYHSKISAYQEKHTLSEAINSQPRKNTVDIILTVDKGSESIHPRGIKSVSLFRYTSSYIKFIQQIGRGVTLREFTNEASYVFDFSEGCVSLLRGNSIGYGRRSTDTRVSRTAIDTLETIVSKLQKELSKNIRINISFATDELKRLSNMMNDLRDDVINKDKLDVLQDMVASVSTAYQIKWYKMQSFENLKALYKLGVQQRLFAPIKSKYTTPYGGIDIELIQWFNFVSKLIITEAYDTKSRSYSILTSLGHIVYMIDSKETDSSQLHTIDSVLASLARLKKNGNDLTPNSTAYKRIMALKKMNFHNELSVNVCTYARHNGLDLSADDISLKEIKKITTDEDKEAYFAYCKEINIADRLKLLIEEKLGNTPQSDETSTKRKKMVSSKYMSSSEDELDEADIAWTELQALHIINGINYTSAYANFIRHKVMVEYPKEFRYGTLSMQTEIDCKHLVRILNDALFTQKTFGGLTQEYLFRHIKFQDLSLMEVMILRFYGVKTNTKYSKLVERTDWMKTYNKAMEGDENAIMDIERINKDKLDPYRRSLINSRKFKAARSAVYQGIADKLILKKAKAFYVYDDKVVAEITDALKQGVVDSEQIILAAFPDEVQKEANELLTDDTIFINMVNGAEKQRVKKVQGVVCSRSSCVPMVLENLLKIQSLDKTVRNKANTLYSILLD